MRHGKKFNHLGRKKGHREAMLSNMACSLIKHKRINTTVAKAKALRKYVEPLITKAKNDTTHNRRVVFSYLQDKYAVSELYREIAPKVMDRPGGYTRILKTGFRLGDNAEMCFIELVDFNETYVKETKKKSTRRRRGGKKKTTSAAATETPATETKVETTEETKTEDTPKAEAPAKEAPAKDDKKADDNKEEEKGKE